MEATRPFHPCPVVGRDGQNRMVPPIQSSRLVLDPPHPHGIFSAPCVSLGDVPRTERFGCRSGVSAVCHTLVIRMVPPFRLSLPALPRSACPGSAPYLFGIHFIRSLSMVDSMDVEAARSFQSCPVAACEPQNRVIPPFPLPGPIPVPPHPLGILSAPCGFQPILRLRKTIAKLPPRRYTHLPTTLAFRLRPARPAHRTVES